MRNEVRALRTSSTPGARDNFAACGDDEQRCAAFIALAAVECARTAHENFRGERVTRTRTRVAHRRGHVKC